MTVINRINRRSLHVTIGVILAIAVIGSWFYAGSPLPGRYQIIGGGGREAITMVDTMTGKIRVFVARRAGSDRHFPTIEFVELTE